MWEVGRPEAEADEGQRPGFEPRLQSGWGVGSEHWGEEAVVPECFAGMQEMAKYCHLLPGPALSGSQCHQLRSEP